MDTTSTKVKQMNIMTSCDEYYIEYVYTQIINISETQKRHVNFFLLYSRISSDKIIKLVNFCDNIINVTFYPIEVKNNIEKYSIFSTNGGFTSTSKKNFPFEVYFQLNIYELLPKWVDRILVIHAADVMMLEDISKFYFSNFHGALVTVELTNYFISDSRTSSNTDLYKESDRNFFIEKYHGETSYFNSGVILLNIELQRNNDRGLDYYIDILNDMKKIIKKRKNKSLFIGDQAFYSIAYLGEINIYNGIQETKKNHRKYNYSIYSYKKDRLYGNLGNSEVKIVHFDGKYKPWLFDENSIEKVANLNLKSSFDKGLHDFAPAIFYEYFLKFWEYDKESPYYKKHSESAAVSGKIWTDFYLPLLKKLSK